MKKCPYCGTEVSDDARYCTKCGKEIQSKKIHIQCPKCYEINDYDASFCKWCGLDIEKEKALIRARKLSNSAPTKKDDKTAVRLAAIIIFIISGIFALITFINICSTIAYGANFNIALNLWNTLVTVLNVFLGIEVIKLTQSGYRNGISFSVIGIIWFGFQAIKSSWALGYFLAALCAALFYLLKTNKSQFQFAVENKETSKPK